MFAFVIFVIWEQFTDVANFAMRECNSLDDLLRFSQYLNADASHAIRRALEDYARRVVNSEWPSLGERRRDPPTEKAFTVLMNAVIRVVPANPTEEASPPEEKMHARLIDIGAGPGSTATTASRKAPRRSLPRSSGWSTPWRSRFCCWSSSTHSTSARRHFRI